jgi:hypothetical protein
MMMILVFHVFLKFFDGKQVGNHIGDQRQSERRGSGIQDPADNNQWAGTAMVAPHHNHAGTNASKGGEYSEDAEQ